jgi:hypothetical protein
MNLWRRFRQLHGPNAELNEEIRRTIRNLWTVNPDFNPQHALTFQVGFSPTATSTPSRVSNSS